MQDGRVSEVLTDKETFAETGRGWDHEGAAVAKGREVTEFSAPRAEGAREKGQGHLHRPWAR